MRRLVLLVSAVVFVDTMFYGSITPLLPYYAERFELSKTSAGVLAGAYAAGAMVGAVPSGLLPARLGVRRTVLVGLALLAVSSLVFGLATNVVVLDVARFVQGLGGACSWAGGLAWLVAGAPRERRGQLIGTAFGAAIFGSLFGPVLGAAAGELGPALVFTGVAIAAVGLAIWAAMLPAPGPGERPTLARFRLAFARPEVALGAWLVALIGLLFGAFEVLAPLRLDALGASGLVVGAAFLTATAVQSVASPLVGRASDRVGRLPPIRIGLAASFVASLVLLVPDTVAVLFVVVVVAANLFGLLWVPGMALVSDGAEAAGLDQSMGFALMNLTWAVGVTLGAAGGGAVADRLGDAVPYGALAALCLVTLLASLRTRVPAAPAEARAAAARA